MAKFFNVTIAVTGSAAPRVPKSLIQRAFTEECGTLEDVKRYFIDRYGRVPKPKAKHKTYVDLKSGGSREEGFVYSYWHHEPGYKAEHRTDWVTIEEVETKPFLNYATIL